VSDLGSPDSEFLVGIHEAVEASLIRKRGISNESITRFDKSYEKTRPEGDTSEPGDHPDAPYRKEHFFATNIERLVAEQMGVDWTEHDERIMKLP
jgi:hypothetical protein